jgi:hypothetical protein
LFRTTYASFYNFQVRKCRSTKRESKLYLKNTLVTDIGQVILDSAKQTFGVKLVNTNYSKKKKTKSQRGINHGLI